MAWATHHWLGLWMEILSMGSCKVQHEGFRVFLLRKPSPAEMCQTLPCDRAKVDALKEWYGEGAGQKHLDKFDAEVQKPCASIFQLNLVLTP
jgi:hypothetical protein